MIVFLCVWLAANLLGLSRFPTVFIDEAENAVHAFNLAHGRGALFSLYDGLYPPEFHFLRHSWPPVIRPFFVYPLAGWIRAVGFGFSSARLWSLLAGAAVLVLVFRLGARWKDRKMGLAAAAILGTRFLFLYSAHTVRPEIHAALAAVLSVTLFQTGVPAGWALGGLLAGMSPGVHTNGAAWIAAFGAWVLLRRKPREILWAGLGGVAGVTFFLLAADWSRFLPGVNALFFRQFAAPPILGLAAHPWQELMRESERYLGPWLFPAWPGGRPYLLLLSVEHALLFAALFAGSRKSGAAQDASALGLLLAAFFALFVGQKAMNYLTLWEPWAALAAADLLTSSDLSRRFRRVAGGTAVALSAAAVLFAVRVAAIQPAFSPFCREVRAQLPDGARVAGPQELWLGLSDTDYRDLGALTWHRLLKNERDLFAPLEKFRPDYLLIDDERAGRLIGSLRLTGRRGRAPTNFLPWPHEILRAWEKTPLGTPMILVRIDWSRVP